MLADGGRIAKTQSAVVLEKLIGQFLFDKALAEARQMTIEMRPAAVAARRGALALLGGCATTTARRRAPIRSSRATA